MLFSNHIKLYLFIKNTAFVFYIFTRIIEKYL